jgi:hypothetical protein
MYMAIVGVQADARLKKASSDNIHYNYNAGARGKIFVDLLIRDEACTRVARTVSRLLNKCWKVLRQSKLRSGLRRQVTPLVLRNTPRMGKRASVALASPEPGAIRAFVLCAVNKESVLISSRGLKPHPTADVIPPSVHHDTEGQEASKARREA